MMPVRMRESLASAGQVSWRIFMELDRKNSKFSTKRAILAKQASRFARGSKFWERGLLYTFETTRFVITPWSPLKMQKLLSKERGVCVHIFALITIEAWGRLFEGWIALDSVFFQRCKNAQKAIKLQIWTWQLIKGKFNFKIPKCYLNQTD